MQFYCAFANRIHLLKNWSKISIHIALYDRLQCNTIHNYRNTIEPGARGKPKELHPEPSAHGELMNPQWGLASMAKRCMHAESWVELGHQRSPASFEGLMNFHTCTLTHSPVSCFPPRRSTFTPAPPQKKCSGTKSYRTPPLPGCE